jgi:DNA-binding MarR family transcriptional regulator
MPRVIPKPSVPHAERDTLSSRLAEAEESIRALASFRYALRRFLRFSEAAAEQSGVTPQQHQLMLGVAGHGSAGSATISELAEFLQEKHHSVIGLVNRAVQNGLVIRRQDSIDRRVVGVSLTPRGKKLLLKLTELHELHASEVAPLLASIAQGLRR